MLIPADVLKVAEVYRDHLALIQEFVSDALTLVDAQGLTELWVEQYREPEPRVGITPLKDGRIGTMIWVPDIPDFHHVLAFLRHKDINLFRITGESIGKVDGILFNETDFDTLRKLDEILAGAA